uniref:Uncharacterized protein n=1 Tax=Leersia perrieri TaxID=77586 RepID=A0A0D9XPA9_9ORYZ
MASHQRSASLPSRLHSTESNVEDELQSLRSYIAAPSATIGTMCDGMKRLGDVYSSIEEIMCFPRNAISLSQQKKMVEEELDRSVVLIDLCNAMQENLSELKMNILELQLVLKRRDDAAVQLKFKSFVRMARKTQKPFKKTSSKTTAEYCSLKPERWLSVSLLDCTPGLLMKKIGTPSTSKWSLVSKKFQKRKVVCEEEQLQALERIIGDLEYGTEFLFRRLIQTRVFLLNILSS